MKLSTVFRPSNMQLIVSLVAILSTTLLCLLADWSAGRRHALDFAYHFNAKAIEEALNMKVSLPIVVLSMSIGLLAALLAAGTPNDRRPEVRQAVLKPVPFDDYPANFRQDQWLNTPTGVSCMLALMDAACAKAGATITATVAGANLYWLMRGMSNFWLTLASLVLVYMLCVFPALVRYLIARERS